MKLTLSVAEDRVREINFTKTGLQHTLQTCDSMTCPEHCVATHLSGI